MQGASGRLRSVRNGVAALIALSLLSGCSPEVGSDAWCRQMSEKPKGDWSANDTADFAKHCLFRRNDG